MSSGHYWTGCPPSQYRNKSILDHLASRDYFEAGRGKNVCDGIGDVAKCSAAQAIKQRKTEMQDAQDFYRWAVSQESWIHYVIYGSTTTEKKNALDKIKTMGSLKAIRGAIKIRAARAVVGCS